MATLLSSIWTSNLVHQSLLGVVPQQPMYEPKGPWGLEVNCDLRVGVVGKMTFKTSIQTFECAYCKYGESLKL